MILRPLHPDSTPSQQPHEHTAEPSQQRGAPPPSPAPTQDDDAGLPDLIPVRMLNEFTYCPRLGYLEWVDGEWADNLETMQGSFGHRRVDWPDKKQIPDPKAAAAEQPEADSPPDTAAVEPAPLHARSLMLSAPREGLLAKLDLLELEGTQATPVDYKRGHAPKIPEGAYEPERVQLCAQGLILRENGFQCDRGVLYFIASKKRVTIEFTDELVHRTRFLRDEFRRTAAAGTLPPPLVDSPKCPRCSLVGICLPDETNWLNSRQMPSLPDAGSALEDDGDAAECPTVPAAGTPAEIARFRVEPPGGYPHESDAERMNQSAPTTASAAAEPDEESTTRVRRLIPAGDDALPLYVQTQGAMIGKSAERLTVKLKDELLAERRLMDVSQISVFGNVMFSAPALREATIRGIPVCHFTYGGWFHAITAGLVHNNVGLRIEQYATAADPVRSLTLARQWISGKIRNARTLLRRHLTDDDAGLLPALNEYRRRSERVSSAESLLGLEGMAAKTYFAGLFRLLNERHEFDVTDRNRRPPRDPVNAVLSFVYALLVKELTIVLQAVGFDPMLGFFHRPRYGRPGLALDMAEEFRPLVGDSVMLMAFNNGELSSGDFLERAGAVTLTESGRKSLIAAFERRMNQEVTHPVFGYRISYRRILEVQCRLLARAVTGELPEYQPFCTR